MSLISKISVTSVLAFVLSLVQSESLRAGPIPRIPAASDSQSDGELPDVVSPWQHYRGWGAAGYGHYGRRGPFYRPYYGYVGPGQGFYGGSVITYPSYGYSGYNYVSPNYSYSYSAPAYGYGSGYSNGYGYYSPYVYGYSSPYYSYSW